MNLFFVFLGTAAWQDLRTRSISLEVLAGGAAVGIITCIWKERLPGEIVLATKTLLVCKPDLFYEGFIVLFQLVEPVLHLEDNIVFCCMVHLIQFIRSEFFTHDVRLSF